MSKPFNLSLPPRELIPLVLLILLLMCVGLSNAPYRNYLGSGSSDGLEKTGQLNESYNIAKEAATATNLDQLGKTVSETTKALTKPNSVK